MSTTHRLSNVMHVEIFQFFFDTVMHTLNSVLSTSLMSLLFLYPKTLGTGCSRLKPHFLCHVSPPNVMGFDIQINPVKPHAHTHHVVPIAMSTSCYSIMSFACHTTPLLPRLHVNTTKLLDITCTLVATSVTLQSVECVYSIAPSTTSGRFLEP